MIGTGKWWVNNGRVRWKASSNGELDYKYPLLSFIASAIRKLRLLCHVPLAGKEFMASPFGEFGMSRFCLIYLLCSSQLVPVGEIFMTSPFGKLRF